MPPRLVLPLLLSLLAAPAAASEEAPAAAGEASAAEGEAPPPPSAPPSFELDVVLAGGFKGDFGRPRCRGDAGPSVEPSAYPSLVAAAATTSVEAEAAGRPAPLFLHTGDLHFPGALPRYGVAGGDEGLDALFTLMEGIPWDGVGLGGLDLSLPPDGIGPFFAAAADRGFPLLAANVSCAADAPRPEVCAALGTHEGGTPWRIVERGGARIAVLSVLDPTHAGEISSAKREGLAFAAFKDTVAPLVERIRGGDVADLVVVLHHSRNKSSELAVRRALPDLHGIDLVVHKQRRSGVWGKLGATPEGADLGWERVPRSGAWVLTSARGVGEATFARVEVRREGDGWTLEPLTARLRDVSGVPPDEATTARVDALGEAYCGLWGGPVAAAVELAGPLDGAAFQRYVLDAMRHEARTELALLNAGALRNPDLLPVTDHLSRADLHALLPFGGTLVRARIPGDQLWFFSDTSLVGGLTREGNQVRVNGRPIDPTRTYTIVMNRFVADGGDSILMPQVLKRRTDVVGEDGSPRELVDLLEDSLREGWFVTRRTGLLDPTRRFVDLHARPVFRFNLWANVSYSKVVVENPDAGGAPAYDKGELLTFAADKFQGDARLGFTAKARDHELGANAFVLYSFARFEEEYGGLLEMGDWVRGRAWYDFVGLRSRASDHGMVPVPFVEGRLTTEFDPPKSRDWHRFELTAIAGAKVRPWRPLNVNVGFNVRREVLEPGARALPGIFVGYTLDRTVLFQIKKTNPVELESDTSWFFNDLGRDDIHEIRHFTRLYVALFGRLYLSASATVYAYREKPVGEWGAYVDATLGFSVGAVGAVQAL